MIELVQCSNEKGLSVLKALRLLSLPRSTYYSNLKLDKRGQKEDNKAVKSKERLHSRTKCRFIYSDNNDPDNDARKVRVEDKSVLE